MRQHNKKIKEGGGFRHKEKFIDPKIEKFILSPSKETKVRGAWCTCAGCGFGCVCSST